MVPGAYASNIKLTARTACSAAFDALTWAPLHRVEGQTIPVGRQYKGEERYRPQKRTLPLSSVFLRKAPPPTPAFGWRKVPRTRYLRTKPANQYELMCA